MAFSNLTYGVEELSRYQIMPAVLTDKGPLHIKSDKLHYAPCIFNKNKTSLNWAGYVLKIGHKNLWVNRFQTLVPSLIPSPHHSSVSAWTGLGGYFSKQMIAAGFTSTFDPKNQAQQNYFWFQVYPHDAQIVTNLPISIGDKVEIFVASPKMNQYHITFGLPDKHEGLLVPPDMTKSSKIKRTSANFIVEAPTEGKQVRSLANFGTITFELCLSHIYGEFAKQIPLNALIPVTMATKSKVIKAQPSGLAYSPTVPSKVTFDFNVNWQHE